MTGNPTWIRAAALALTFALPPTSAAFAQQRGPQGGGAGGVVKRQARPAAKPAQAARPAQPGGDMMRHTEAMNGQARKANLANGTPRNNANIVRPRPSNASIVSSLHSTRMQLARVDQDYNGHRSRAMRDIEEAMRLMGNRSDMGGMEAPGVVLSGNMAGVNRGSGSTTSNRPVTATGRPMNQAASDTRLREARRILANLDSQMDTSGMNPHTYVRAKDAVQSAIRQLNLALIDQ